MKNRWCPYRWLLFITGILVGMYVPSSCIRRERQKKYAEMVEKERRIWKAQLEEMRRSRTENIAVSESLTRQEQVEKIENSHAASTEEQEPGSE